MMHEVAHGIPSAIHRFSNDSRTFCSPRQANISCSPLTRPDKSCPPSQRDEANFPPLSRDRSLVRVIHGTESCLFAQLSTFPRTMILYLSECITHRPIRVTPADENWRITRLLFGCARLASNPLHIARRLRSYFILVKLQPQWFARVQREDRFK